jgi:hypothetical protein
VVAQAPLEFDMSILKAVALGLLIVPALAAAELEVVIIEGLGGEERYVQDFAAQVTAIENAADALTSSSRIRVFRSGEFSRDDVIEYFAGLGERIRPDDRLALFLVGHGSFDEHEYKFNIAGPDLTDGDLFDLLDRSAAGSELIVNTSSSSGATLDRLKGDNRTLILATRSGVERHATRFGNYFVAALTDASADLDKNQLITADEAYQFAARQVSDYYERNGQLATEHPRIEGEQGARFSLARLGAARPARADSVLDRLLAERAQLNTDIEELRLRRDAMTPDAYQAELLNNMLELATVEEEIERREAELAGED